MDSSAHLQVQCLLGVQCEHFVMIAADQTNIQSVVLVKDDENKIFNVSDKIIVGMNGDYGDMGQFSQFVSRNLALYRLRNGYPLGPAATVHFIRRKQAELLRSGIPYQLNYLIGGYDEREGPQLFFVDFLSSSHSIGYAAHGLGGVLSVSILDRYYNPTMKEKEAYNLLVMCVKEIQQRLMIQLPTFQVSLVDKDGIRCLDTIVRETPVKNLRIQPGDHH